MEFLCLLGTSTVRHTAKPLWVLLWLLSFWTCSQVLPSLAADWPQLLGPHRNGTYPDVLPQRWPEEGPGILWKIAVGEGYSGPAVADGRVILLHRVVAEEVVECLSAKTGKSLWRFSYPTKYIDQFGFNDGPRATPTIQDGRVYTFGAEGKLHCLEFLTGKLLWKVDTRKLFNPPDSFFGAACSPLVDDKRVLMNVGGNGPNGQPAGLVAFDAKTGKLLWNSTQDTASYSSPALGTFQTPQGKKRLAVFFTRTGLVGADPQDGTVKFHRRWRPRINASVNAATPLILPGNRIFISTSYQTGALLSQVTPDWQLKELWSGDQQLTNHYATSVFHEDHLYGFHGRQESGQALRCVEAATGKVRWSREMPAGHLILAGSQLLVLREDGKLLRLTASPAGYQQLQTAQILQKEVRALPALAAGVLFARDNQSTLIAVDLQGKKTNQ